jgi:hypothetical protein
MIEFASARSAPCAQLCHLEHLPWCSGIEETVNHLDRYDGTSVRIRSSFRAMPYPGSFVLHSDRFSLRMTMVTYGRILCSTSGLGVDASRRKSRCLSRPQIFETSSRRSCKYGEVMGLRSQCSDALEPDLASGIPK